LDENRNILWIGRHLPPPPNVRQATLGWNLLTARDDQPLAAQLEGASLAIVWPSGYAADPALLEAMLAELGQSHAVSIFLLPRDDERPWRQIARRQGQFLCVAQDAPAEQIAARLAVAAELAPALQALQAELAVARDQKNGSQRLIAEMDEEMRLAARLQRDFLPRRLPEVGAARFGVLYRPATWVSGDIYDIIRLDETHVGFYVADVVGHGMPAALLTMFIKKALQTKRIIGSTYRIVPPETAMAELNTDICDQNLSSCQFCTAVYAILDTSTLELTYSRAGHPEPLLVNSDIMESVGAGGNLGATPQARPYGSSWGCPVQAPRHPQEDLRVPPVARSLAQVHTERLNSQGGLLGIFPDAQFTAQTIQLHPGQRLLVYSDGLEEAMRPPGAPREVILEEMLDKIILRPRDEMLLRLSEQMDLNRGESPLADDVTALVLDIE
jgi:sigma-B regulation protein RsbU (phosphoserine phosphatase)